MNDRFKFRCIINNKVKDVFYFYELPTNKEIVFVCTNLEDNTGYNIPKGQLLQCTGLKDKNGKLIYEGDIVLLPDEEDIPYVVNYDIGRAMFVVESQILHLCCNFDNYYGKELEVIGNKFENPELLKGCE